MSPIQEGADVGALATRVASLAVELDRVVAQIAAVPLTEDDALVLTAPAAHLTLVNAELGGMLYELECRGRIGVQAIPLTAGEMPRLRAA
jgi:hypothetical protein